VSPALTGAPTAGSWCTLSNDTSEVPISLLVADTSDGILSLLVADKIVVSPTTAPTWGVSPVGVVTSNDRSLALDTTLGVMNSDKSKSKSKGSSIIDRLTLLSDGVMSATVVDAISEMLSVTCTDEMKVCGKLLGASESVAGSCEMDGGVVDRRSLTTSDTMGEADMFDVTLAGDDA
jgi:hypothetical protein